MGTFPGLAGHTHCGPFPGEPPGWRCFLCPSLPFPWEPLLSGPPLPPAPAPVLPGSAPRVPGLPTLLVNIPGQPWPLQALPWGRGSIGCQIQSPEGEPAQSGGVSSSWSARPGDRSCSIYSPVALGASAPFPGGHVLPSLKLLQPPSPAAPALEQRVGAGDGQTHWLCRPHGEWRRGLNETWLILANRVDRELGKG